MSTISLSGFNNIDFKSIIDIIIQSERQGITRLETQRKSEQARLAQYGTLSSTLSSLESAFASLGLPTAFGSLTSSSSDSTVLTTSTTSEAAKGSFTINVVSLARPQVTISAERQFSDINASIIDGGTFSITQAGSTTNIDLTGIDTLKELRDAINSKQSGVKASIINDGSSADSPAKPFRLVLTSALPGAANAFSVTDQTSFTAAAPGTVLNLSTDPTNGTARDSEFTYNGITIHGSSNTITDAVPGLTLKLFKTGTTTVSVTDDDSNLKTKIKAAVAAFNAFNDFAQAQFKIPTDGTSRPPLATDPILRGVNRQLRNYLIADHASSGVFHNLADLGIELDQTGKLKLDEAKLDSVLASNRSDVEAFLSQTGGFVDKIKGLIKSYSDGGKAIDLVEGRVQKTIDSFAAKIQRMEVQLAFREEMLTKQFTAADKAISQLNSQVNSLSGLSGQFRLF